MINVATKKMVCRKYCELKDLIQLSPKAKRKIHSILGCIVEELVANPESSISKKNKCKVDERKVKNDSDSSSPSTKGLQKKDLSPLRNADSSQYEDGKENCGVNSSDSINNNDNAHEASSFHKKKHHYMSCGTDKILEKNKNHDMVKDVSSSKIKDKRRLKRIRSKDVMELILDSDDANVLSSDISSPCTTPRKMNRGERIVCEESPLVRRKSVSKRRRVLAINESDSEIDNCVEASLVDFDICNEKQRIRRIHSDSEDCSNDNGHTIQSDSNTDDMESKCASVFSESDSELENGELNNESDISSIVALRTCQVLLKDCLKDKSPLTIDSDGSITCSPKYSSAVKRKLSCSSMSSLNDDSDVQGSNLTAGKVLTQIQSPRRPFNISSSNTDIDEKEELKQDTERIKTKQYGSKTLKNLRAICRHIGLFLRNTIELKGCDTDEEKVRRIRTLLCEKGMKGNLSMKNAEHFKLQQELRELTSSSPMKCQSHQLARKRKFFSSSSSSNDDSDNESSNLTMDRVLSQNQHCLKSSSASPNTSSKKKIKKKCKPGKSRSNELKCKKLREDIDSKGCDREEEKDEHSEVELETETQGHHAPRERKSSLSSLPSLSDGSDVESSNLTTDSNRVLSQTHSHSKSCSLSASIVSVKEKKEKKQKTMKEPENKTMKNLRSICRHIGLILRNTIELKGCDTDEEKVKRIKSLLREKGMKGKLTMENAEQLILERELKELGAINIGSSSPAKRSRKHLCRGDDFFSQKNSSTAVHLEASDDFSHMKDIFCADDSSD